MAALLIRLIGLLLMATAVAVAVSRAPDRPVQSLVARWAPPPSDFLDLRGQLVHLRDEGPRHDGAAGTPPPLLLLHGTSASLHTWEGWVRALKGQRRVITLDLPGFGLTGPFTGDHAPDDYRGETYAAFVLELMERLHLQRVVLGGNSLGGEIAWRVALRAPQRVAALVLVDAVGPAFTPERVPLGFQVARLPVLGRLSEHLLPRALVAQTLHEVYGDPRRVSEELVERYFELTLREGNRRALGLRLAQMAAAPGEGAERVSTLTMPTLILWGALDRLVPPENGRWFAQRIAGSRLVVFDGLGHVPQEEDPARTVAALQAFLAGR